MTYRFCPNCYTVSYSQSEHKIWLCPNCGKDISFMPDSAEPPSRPKPRQRGERQLKTVD